LSEPELRSGFRERLLEVGELERRRDELEDLKDELLIIIFKVKEDAVTFISLKHLARA